MKRLMLLSLSLLFFALPPAISWSQDDAEKESTEVQEDANTEESPEQEMVKEPPTRLPGNIPRPQIPTNEDDSMRLLADYLDEDSLLWLENDSERFLSIWQKDRSGYPKGALLIVHAEGEHPAWPNTTKPLHDTLPDYGWATLAISLPKPDLPPTPERTLPVKAKPAAQDNSENSESEETEQSTENTEPKTTTVNNQTTGVLPSTTTQKQTTQSAELISERRLESALRFLHDQGQFNLILLGSGSGAIRAHDFLDKITPKISNPKLKETFEKPVRAMIIVNGRNQLPTMDKLYKGWFSDPDIPVLDIFVETDYRNREEAKVRKVLARQKKVSIYKQVRMTELTHEKSWGENRLSRRVRSFLDTNAVGIEVKNARLRRYK
jgi:ribosomal protein L12E/L44/L45/RPP1/RPP2